MAGCTEAVHTTLTHKQELLTKCSPNAYTLIHWHKYNMPVKFTALHAQHIMAVLLLATAQVCTLWTNVYVKAKDKPGLLGSYLWGENETHKVYVA